MKRKKLKKSGQKINIDSILEKGREPFRKNISNRTNLRFVTSESSVLKDWDRASLWHPYTQMKDYQDEEPLIIEEGRGSFLKDIEGRWYLDGISSLWVNLHGHRKKDLDFALKKQIDKISHSTLLGLGNVPSIELAKMLLEITPEGLTRIFYSDDGSTAVEIALKMAFQYWQQKGEEKRTKIISFFNAYHGDTIGSVSIGGVALFRQIFNPLLFETLKVKAPYCYRCHLNLTKSTCKIKCIDELKKILSRNHKEVAALIIEPLVQGAGGMITQPKGFLRKVRSVCNKYKILMIVDEVATGFGRTGKMFACEWEGISPDILCLAKSITAGYLPLAVTVTTNEVYQAFLGGYGEKKTFFHGHTYAGNPLACACAIASLKIFSKEKILMKLEDKITFLKEGLKHFQLLEHVGDIRQKGFIVGIELVKDKKTKEPYPWEGKIGIKVTEEARKLGVILRPLGNVIVLMPPLSITKRELKILLNVTYLSIKTICTVTKSF